MPDEIMIFLREMRSEFRDELRVIERRMDARFSEVNDRLRRLDERIDGFIKRLERLES